jgi:tripartite-type tricarboxylate transporter receptor subunit TctC
MNMKRALLNVTCAVGSLGLIAVAGPQARAAGPEDFYRGKTVSMIIGYSVGGGYDLYARALAKYLGKYIPGSPAVIAQNMPGAGSLKAVEYLYGVAAKDGTVLGTFGRALPLSPLLEGATFDASKLEWIGSITHDTSLCIAWHGSKFKTWDDLKANEFTAGGEGKGSDPDQFAVLLKNLFQLKIKLVSGYPGTAEITLAVERGELDGLCGISLSTLQARHQDWIDTKKVNILVQAALEKNPGLPNVPLLLDLATSETQKQILRLILSAQSMARPFAMPPGTPPDRVEAMRGAFMAALRDKEFLAEAAKARLEVNPKSGAEIAALIRDVYATPVDTVKEAIRAAGY